MATAEMHTVAKAIQEEFGYTVHFDDGYDDPLFTVEDPKTGNETENLDFLDLKLFHKGLVWGKASTEKP